MPLRREGWGILRNWTAAVMGIMALGLAVYFWVRQPAEKTHRLTLTAGRASGQRHQIGEMLAEEARRRGLDARMRETAGSEDALDQLNAGVLDVALVQGGLGLGQRGNVRQVAALHVEPLHLLVKAELFPEVAKSLTALQGKVVNLSEPGSGTHTLALEILCFAGLTPGSDGRPGDVTPATLGYGALMAETDRGKLPDAVFMVQSLPSPVARHLITRRDYRIVPLPFAEAFALDALNNKAEVALVPAQQHVEKRNVYDTVIPAFTYGVEPPVPAAPIHTLGTRLLVVAHKDADAMAIDRLLETMFGSPFAQVARPPLDAKLLELPPEFPLHPAAVEYVQRTKPLIAADVVDYSEKVIAIGATVAGGLFFSWQALRQWHSRRQERNFKHHLVAVSKIEQQALELERSANLDLPELLHLQKELNQLKDQTLSKFAGGELHGEQLVSGFLTLVNDARNYLTRLILHERENLEHRAAHQGRQVQDIWPQTTRELPHGPPPSGEERAATDGQSTGRPPASGGESGTA